MWGLLPRTTQVSVLVAIVVYSGWVISEVTKLATGTAMSPLKSAPIVTTILRHHVATATTLDRFFDPGHVRVMFYRSKSL
jgi:hypothetical protein